MSLSLKEHNAVVGMAEVLYDFLPGSGSKQWSRHVTFATMAAKLGVADNCTGGSKLPAITELTPQPRQFPRLAQTSQRNSPIHQTEHHSIAPRTRRCFGQSILDCSDVAVRRFHTMPTEIPPTTRNPDSQ